MEWAHYADVCQDSGQSACTFTVWYIHVSTMGRKNFPFNLIISEFVMFSPVGAHCLQNIIHFKVMENVCQIWMDGIKRQLVTSNKIAHWHLHTSNVATVSKANRAIHFPPLTSTLSWRHCIVLALHKSNTKNAILYTVDCHQQIKYVFDFWWFQRMEQHYIREHSTSNIINDSNFDHPIYSDIVSHSAKLNEKPLRQCSF